MPGACDPADANSCDLRKRERCLSAPRQPQPQQYQVHAPAVPPLNEIPAEYRKHKEEQTYVTSAFGERIFLILSFLLQIMYG